MLDAQGAGYRIRGQWIVRNIGLHVRAGGFWALVGPNGAGKTTLLRMLSGELRPSAGAILFNGSPIEELTTKELARQRACLTQHRTRKLPFTAHEIVLLGRQPHTRGLRESPRDYRVTADAMARTHVTPLANRIYATLSGGESSRTDLARVLAQEPRLLLLDEPTNHLDIRHQFALLRLCREVADSGSAVVAVLHDLNLASHFADRILLMDAGRCVTQGTPEHVLVPEIIEHVYKIPCAVQRHPSGCPWILPCPDTAPTRGEQREETLTAMK